MPATLYAYINIILLNSHNKFMKSVLLIVSVLQMRKMRLGEAQNLIAQNWQAGPQTQACLRRVQARSRCAMLSECRRAWHPRAINTATPDLSLSQCNPLCFYFKQVIQSRGLNECVVLTAGCSKCGVRVPKVWHPGFLEGQDPSLALNSESR